MFWLLLRNFFILTKQSDKLTKYFGNVCENQKNLEIFTKIFGYVKQIS